MKINRFAALAAIAVLVVVTLSVLAVQVFAQNGGPFPPEPDDGEESESEAPTGEAAITAQEAEAAAQTFLGDDSTPSEVELENERGTLVYSVEFSGVEVEVDALTGEVVGAWSDDD